MGETLQTTARPAGRNGGTRRVLIVEPDAALRAVLEKEAAGSGTRVTACADFATARASLRGGVFDFLVTNLRLGAYNGLHLVYLTATGAPGGDGPRSIIYCDGHDPWLAREGQSAGAFYEIGECLPATLTSYLRGPLPVHDRRNPDAADPGAVFEGGRRRGDHLASAAGGERGA
jgi:CheY-like chemotaxis protein